MKTIEVTDEQFEALKNMAGLLKTQDHRSTQHPIFCVYENKLVPKPEDCGDEGWFTEEGHLLTEEEMEEDVAEWREENPEEAKKYDEDDDERIMKDELNYQIHYYEYENVRVDQGQYYFTEKAAQHHIDCNHYHYREPFTYVESAWRNPEWELIREVLMKTPTFEEAK